MGFDPMDVVSVTTRFVAQVPVVRVTGEIDTATAVAFADPVYHLLAARPRGIVLDLRDVNFFGSAGLNVLVEANNRAEASKSDLRLVAGRQRAVTRPLEISGLATMFQLSTSVVEAVAAVCDPG